MPINPPKPDDRSDNMEKLKDHIEQTIENIEEAKDTLEMTHDPNERNEIIEKNKRRERAIDGFREEIADEFGDKMRGKRKK